MIILAIAMGNKTSDIISMLLIDGDLRLTLSSGSTWQGQCKGGRQW